MDSNIKLSNVIGAPFSDYVLQQLYIRAARNSTTNRTNEEVLFLANKSGWARLISSVDIDLSPSQLKEYYNKLGVGPGYDTPRALARNWVLEAGTSKQSGNGITLRSGIGPDGAYGLGGTEELGYRPMPGLTSVVVETTGRLGSLRQATINFQAWNMNQLNVVEALYFRLGYSMLLEWGHTQYFANDNSFKTSEIYGIDNPFEGIRKEAVQQKIAQKTRMSNGNYGGMLGIVSNFTWSLNEAGGYDCTVRLIGQGAIMDSLKTNQAYTLPTGFLKEYKKNQSAIQTAIDKAVQKRVRAIADEQARVFANQQPIIDPVPTNRTELLARLKKYNLYPETKTVNDLVTEYGVDAFTTVENFTTKTLGSFVGYYTLFNSSPNAGTRIAAENAYGGFWFDQPAPGFTLLPYTDNNRVVFNTALLNSATKVITVRDSNNNLTSLATLSTQKTPINQYFDYQTGTIIRTQGRAEGYRAEVITVPLTAPLYQPAEPIRFNLGELVSRRGGKQSIYVTITVTTDSDRYFQPTRNDLLNVLNSWQTSTDAGVLNNVTLSSKERNTIIITGKYTTQLVVNYSGPEAERVAVTQTNGGGVKSIQVTFTVETNNPGFITKVLPSTPVSDVSRQIAGLANPGISDSVINQANTSQVESTTGFTSALHAMLVIVQTKVQASTLNVTTAAAVSILKETEGFFQDGSLRGVLGLPRSTPVGPEGIPFDLQKYGQKGYNSSLMTDKTLYDYVPDVDYKKLCQAYAVKYKQGGEEGTTESVHCPVYITLGYLLAFLNNMCLIYDSREQTTPSRSSQGSEKRPYIYIDFNPETNFCLTSPQQMSVDPFTCLIPFNATLSEYKNLFPSKTIADTLDPVAFDPQANNVLTDALNKSGLEFKTLQGGTAYQGKMMNILLNVDYLLGLIRDFAGADAEHAVNLQPFLERILKDVNKSLGNINSFRVGYRDESNTVQLLDDQWVPAYKGATGSDTSMLNSTEYMDKLKGTQKVFSGLLPLFNSTMPAQLPVAGTFSLARQFQFKTVLSTKLASMIAISAQASTGSVNSKDHSSLSYLNENFQDRYKPYIGDPSAVSTGANSNSKQQVNQKSNDQKAAELFNVHVESVYSNLQLSADKVDLARNYYIERMSKVKSSDTTTSSAPFIPADLEITIDGVSGIIMGNAFTIPEDRLPLSLRGVNGKTKIAFIVTGLTHTIEQNEWLTRIRGQMIKLRSDVNIPTAVATITAVQKAIAAPLPAYAGLTGNAIEDAVNFIKLEEQLYSAVPNGYKPVLNPSSNTLVYAYKVGTDVPTIGWGTTIYAQGVSKGKNVTIKDVITVGEAEAELRATVAKLYRDIESSLRPEQPLTGGELTALLSIAYNTGLGALQGSQIWTGLRQGTDRELIAQAIRNFATTRKSDRQVLQGLITRRQKESQIFLS